MVPKTNTLKKNKSNCFKFRWWMALILVGIVAVIGITVLCFSHASGPTQTYSTSSSY